MSQFWLAVYDTALTLIAIAAGAVLAVWGFSGLKPGHNPRLNLRGYGMVAGWGLLFALVWLLK